MANTTNYNWETPDDTDLVKDGAAAIRTLGSSIDTTTKNLNPETTTGDIAYRSATANTNTRLAIGSSGQVLTVAAGVPSWATPSTFTSPLTTKGDIYTRSATADTRLPVGTNGHTLVADSAEATGLKWQAPAGVTIQTATFNDTKASSTTGGTFTSGAWRTRDLQTTQSNSITGCSLASNQITLPAGTFRITGFAPATFVDRHQTRIYNITGSAMLILGMSAYNEGNVGSVGASFFDGVVTLASSTVIELQHYGQTTQSSFGFGNSITWGDAIFSTITITKVA
jgi:hypothetical protein